MTILVTGATSGIGLATAVALARDGQDIALVGRTRTSADGAAKLVRAAAPDIVLSTYGAELSLRRQVESLASAVARDHPRLDGLVLAAGVANPDSATADGLDTTLAVNHVAPARLVRLLQPNLAGGRIILVGSSQHGRAGAFDPAVFDSDGSAAPMRRYEATKLLNLLYAAGRHQHVQGSPLEVVDPGFVRTNLGRRSTGAMRVLLTVTRAIQTLPERPAAFIARRLKAPDFEDGAYRAEKGDARVGSNARDQASIDRAWEWTEQLLGS